MQKTKEKQVGFEGLLVEPRSSNLNIVISSRRFFIELLLIVALAAVAYGTWSTLWIKFSRAEVFFAECAREMLVTNNFITPLYHAQPFFDKPIFVYWLIIAMFKTFGTTHLAARIPIIFASLTTIVATAIAGSYIFGKRAGLLSAFLLSSSFIYLSFSTLCMSDMFLVMFDALSLIAIYAGVILENNRTKYWWLAALSMGFAFLTKGPVGIVLPALSALIYLAIERKLSLIRGKHILFGLMTILVVASPWFYAAYLANGPQSMVHFFIQENLQRFAGSTYDAHRPFWYTIVSFFLGFAPWSFLVPLALFWFYKNVRKSENKLNNEKKVERRTIALSAEMYLWIWVFVSVGFFCFSRGKCDYYTMPAFTAAALLVSHYVMSCMPKYASAIKALAVTILLATILGAVFVLPEINKLLPVDKYTSIIKSGPDNLRIGIDETAASWIDEILFQSGKDPERLSNLQQTEAFIGKNGPTLLIMPQDKYNLLSANQRKNYQIMSCDKVSTHPLTPGFLFSKKGNIADAVPLIAAINYQQSTQ